MHLLRALDMYDPSLGYENVKEALSRIKARYTLVSVTTDQLLNPLIFIKVNSFRAKWSRSTFYEFPSDYGHDAFLVDYDQFEKRIRDGLAGN